MAVVSSIKATRKTAGTPRACYVCYKPTPTVLATVNTVDFIYACDTHLKDPGFATRISDTPDVTTEAIAKVKEEYEAAQQKAKRKAAEKSKEGAEEGKDGHGKETEASKGAKPRPPSTPGALGSGSPGVVTPKHEKYSLHRHIFAMRQDEHRRRRQASEARTLAPKLPSAPSGSVSM